MVARWHFRDRDAKRHLATISFLHWKIAMTDPLVYPGVFDAERCGKHFCRGNIPAALEGSGSLRRRVGRYELVARIGGGAMGIVYRAHDPSLRRDVAIKLPTFDGSAEVCALRWKRFWREASAAAAVRHPH